MRQIICYSDSNGWNGRIDFGRMDVIVNLRSILLTFAVGDLFKFKAITMGHVLHKHVYAVVIVIILICLSSRYSWAIAVLNSSGTLQLSPLNLFWSYYIQYLMPLTQAQVSHSSLFSPGTTISKSRGPFWPGWAVVDLIIITSVLIFSYRKMPMG